jgi:hypothetical protein
VLVQSKTAAATLNSGSHERITMISFKSRLAENTSEYHYRIKTVVEPDEQKMADIERLLKRYDLISIDTPGKVSSHNDIINFKDIESADVWSVDFIIGVPMSAYILQQELRSVLSIPEKFVIVRADNEPLEVYTTRHQLLRQLDQKAREEGLSPASLLSTDREYLDAEQPILRDVFGDKYNMRLLAYLAHVAQSRQIMNQTESDVEDSQAFNQHHSGVKPVSAKDAVSEPPVANHYVAPDGNFDDDVKTYFRVTKDANGDRKVLSATSDPMRKEAS